MPNITNLTDGMDQKKIQSNRSTIYCISLVDNIFLFLKHFFYFYYIIWFERQFPLLLLSHLFFNSFLLFLFDSIIFVSKNLFTQRYLYATSSCCPSGANKYSSTISSIILLFYHCF